MLCAKCGAALAEGSRFCRVCGSPLSAVEAGPAAPGPADLPQTSGKAIASLTLSLFLFFPLAIVAVVLGHLSLSEIRNSAGRLKGEGIAIAGLILGYIGVVAIPLVLIVAAIAIPNLLRARMVANESSAAQAVRLLTTAEINYSRAYPEEGFSCDLRKMVRYGGLNPTLGTGQNNGYVFEIQNCTTENLRAPNTRFQVIAYPTNVDQTGVRAFCSDESAVIKFDASGSAQACLESGPVLQ